MFYFSMKKYFRILIFMGALSTSNAWAGCDIDWVSDKSENDETALLTIKYDLGSGACMDEQWDYAFFTLIGSNGLKVANPCCSIPLALYRGSNNYHNTYRVPRGDTVTVYMKLGKYGSNLLKHIDSAVERVR